MKSQISKNIDRLNLHDSHFEKIVRIQNKMILTLDWAKLENYSEIGLQEGIILGKCILTFEDFYEEKLLLDFTGSIGNEFLGKKEMEFDYPLFKDFLISESKLIDNKHYTINGLSEYGKKYGWLEWSFLFSNFILAWNNHITWTEWRNGKIVED